MSRLLLGLLGAVLWAGQTSAQAATPPPARPPAPTTPRYEPSASAHRGREIVAVVLGSAECAASTWPRFMEVVDPMLGALKAQATARGLLFTAVGIAIEEPPDSGLTYLRRLAHFDEVIVGRGWINSGLAYYFPPGGPTSPATPALLVFAREYSDGVESPRLVQLRQLIAVAGADSIRAFAQRGAPLDPLIEW